jgi:hypothetical protein
MATPKDTPKSAPKEYVHGKPKNMDVPPDGAAVGLDGNPDPQNLRGGVGPRSSPAHRPNPRISPAARAVLDRTKGGNTAA